MSNKVNSRKTKQNTKNTKNTNRVNKKRTRLNKNSKKGRKYTRKQRGGDDTGDVIRKFAVKSGFIFKTIAIIPKYDDYTKIDRALEDCLREFHSSNKKDEKCKSKSEKLDVVKKELSKQFYNDLSKYLENIIPKKKIDSKVIDNIIYITKLFFEKDSSSKNKYGLLTDNLQLNFENVNAKKIYNAIKLVNDTSSNQSYGRNSTSVVDEIKKLKENLNSIIHMISKDNWTEYVEDLQKQIKNKLESK